MSTYAPALLASPGVVGVGDVPNVFAAHVPVGAIHHVAHLAGIDKQYLARPLPVRTAQARSGQEPKTGRYRSGVEELTGQSHHAIHQSASTIASRIFPSPDCLEDMEPLARTNPADPQGDRWWIMCCTQAKLALREGGTPYFQRMSFLRRSPPQSEMLKGGLARM